MSPEHSVAQAGIAVRDRFLKACGGERVDRTPVWFMRQAGRYLPEYRELRGEMDVLAMCREPEVAAEVSMLPLLRLDVDAAILFSDIMVPVAAIGLEVEIVRNEGPTLARPFRSEADLARFRPLEPERDIPYTLETIRILLDRLSVPLIGFAGAPFTLASYLIEGGPSRNHARTKALMQAEPSVWGLLMERLTEDVILPYLDAQVAAGVHAVQLFDSWAGALDRDSYREHVLPHSRRIFEGIGERVPTIHFGVGTAHLLELMSEAGADVVGVDWRLPIDEAWDRIGPHGIQGNLDPAVCLAPWDVVERTALDILRRVGGRPGHIFNLGHGVLPQTPPETLERLVELVHGHPAG
ncbi:MAG: uroporphyrinogen decarboxylase [Actinomycetota bacterium]